MFYSNLTKTFGKENDEPVGSQMGQYQRAEVICQCVFIWVTLQIQGRSASTLYSRSEKLQVN